MMASKKALNELQNAIDHAETYQEYYDACLTHDAISGAEEWKDQEKSNDYDYRLIKMRVERIRTARRHDDAAGLMSILHEGIHGNLANISNPALLQHCKVGTKTLIQDFLDEVSIALDFIYNASEDDIDFYEKLSFFDETAHAYGQSCLMLSGGAGLGFFHSGVVKALTEHDLLPNVISGASAGSIIAAMVGTLEKSEILDALSAESIYEKFNRWRVWQGLSGDSLLDSTNLENALIELFDVTTFEQAYNKTGRHITVTVSPADLHQYSRLLNAKTSPNAIISQAVRASCAIPYMFSPVQLRAKTPSGQIVPYIPNRKFADGSLMADLPFGRLARLYGVNHSIVSQTNPLAVPFLPRNKKKKSNLFNLTVGYASDLAKMNSVYVCDLLEKMTSNKSAKLGIHKIRSIIDQQYVGDINILPERGLGNLKYLLSNPTEKSIQELIHKAERATWAQLDLIKRNTQISQKFRKYLKQLKARESALLSKNNAHQFANSN